MDSGISAGWPLDAVSHHVIFTSIALASDFPGRGRVMSMSSDIDALQAAVGFAQIHGKAVCCVGAAHASIHAAIPAVLGPDNYGLLVLVPRASRVPHLSAPGDTDLAIFLVAQQRGVWHLACDWVQDAAPGHDSRIALDTAPPLEVPPPDFARRSQVINVDILAALVARARGPVGAIVADPGIRAARAGGLVRALARHLACPVHEIEKGTVAGAVLGTPAAHVKDVFRLLDATHAVIPCAWPALLGALLDALGVAHDPGPLPRAAHLLAKISKPRPFTVASTAFDALACLADIPEFAVTGARVIVAQSDLLAAFNTSVTVAENQVIRTYGAPSPGYVAVGAACAPGRVILFLEVLDDACIAWAKAANLDIWFILYCSPITNGQALPLPVEPVYSAYFLYELMHKARHTSGPPRIFNMRPQVIA